MGKKDLISVVERPGIIQLKDIVVVEVYQLHKKIYRNFTINTKPFPVPGFSKANRD